MVFSCCQPFGRYVPMRSILGSSQDPLFWSNDLVSYGLGSFSIALVQANAEMEDHCQVESGPFGIFMGLYDGHGGPEAATFLNEHLFKCVQDLSTEQDEMSPNVLLKAFRAMEKTFSDVVDTLWHTMPRLIAVGSCCLVGVVSGQNLYIANAGDSRAVLGTLTGTGSIKASQLSIEHNANNEDVRKELKDMHPDDSNIVVYKDGSWRVKGIIQVSRSVGDIYLKRPEFFKEHPLSWLPLEEPLKRPVMTAEPSIEVHKLQPQDRFLIFASDGLWENVSNQEAVEIVHKYPRAGIARRLVKHALQLAVTKRELRYSDLIKLEPGTRRHFHDDISVVVLYLDTNSICKGASSDLIPISVKGRVPSAE